MSYLFGFFQFLVSLAGGHLAALELQLVRVQVDHGCQQVRRGVRGRLAGGGDSVVVKTAAEISALFSKARSLAVLAAINQPANRIPQCKQF